MSVFWARIGVAVFGLGLAGSVSAECGLENRVVFTCPIADREKQLTVCVKAGLPEPIIAYEMRDMSVEDPLGEVELYLERDIMDVHYVNYGGRGRDMYLNLSFESGNVIYHVDMLNESFLENMDGALEGGVRVFEDGEKIASLDCEAGRGRADLSDLVLGLYQRMGYQWCTNFGNFGIDDMRWRNCRTHEVGFDQVTGEPKPDALIFIVPPRDGFLN